MLFRMRSTSSGLSMRLYVPSNIIFILPVYTTIYLVKVDSHPAII